MTAEGELDMTNLDGWLDVNGEQMAKTDVHGALILDRIRGTGRKPWSAFHKGGGGPETEEWMPDE